MGGRVLHVLQFYGMVKTLEEISDPVKMQGVNMYRRLTLHEY